MSPLATVVKSESAGLVAVAICSAYVTDGSPPRSAGAAQVRRAFSAAGDAASAVGAEGAVPGRVTRVLTGAPVIVVWVFPLLSLAAKVLANVTLTFLGEPRVALAVTRSVQTKSVVC